MAANIRCHAWSLGCAEICSLPSPSGGHNSVLCCELHVPQDLLHSSQTHTSILRSNFHTHLTIKPSQYGADVQHLSRTLFTILEQLGGRIFAVIIGFITCDASKSSLRPRLRSLSNDKLVSWCGVRTSLKPSVTCHGDICQLFTQTRARGSHVSLTSNKTA